MFMRICALLALLLLIACPDSEMTDARGSGGVIGEQYSYELTIASRSDLPKGAVGERTKMDYNLRGGVVLTPLSAINDERQYLLRLTAPELTSDLPDSLPQLTGLGEELRGSPFLFSLRAGKIVEVRMAPGISAFAGAILLTVASQLQLPDVAIDRPLEVQEYDGTGSYTVRYQPGKTPNQLHKSKLRYATLVAASRATKGFSEDALRPKVQSSNVWLEVSDGLLRSLRSDETLTSPVFGAGDVKSHTALTLKLVTTERAPKHDLAQLFTQTSRYEAGKPFFKQPTHHVFDDVRLGGRTFEQISGALTKTQEDPRAREVQKGDHAKLTETEVKDRQGWLNDQKGAFGGLVALYRERPEDIASAVAVIRKAGSNSAVLLNGLATANTPDSRRALVELMQDVKLDATVRDEAAGAFFRLRTVDAEVARAALDALEGPTYTVPAIYAVGTFSRLLREAGELEASVRLAEELTARLKKSTSPSLTVHLLRGISNSAYSPAVSVIEPLITSPEPMVGAAAVDALRLMEDPRVDALIAAEVLKPNTTRDYRLAALGALKGRRASQTIVDAAIERALHDESRSVRFKAVALLGSWQDDFAEAASTLKEISRTDSDKDVRDAAALQL